MNSYKDQVMVAEQPPNSSSMFRIESDKLQKEVLGLQSCVEHLEQIVSPWVAARDRPLPSGEGTDGRIERAPSEAIQALQAHRSAIDSCRRRLTYIIDNFQG